MSRTVKFYVSEYIYYKDDRISKVELTLCHFASIRPYRQREVLMAIDNCFILEDLQQPSKSRLWLEDERESVEIYSTCAAKLCALISTMIIPGDGVTVGGDRVK